MVIRLLGTAAGGGVPPWNCNCPVCREARAGSGRVQSRTQSSVAISADGRHWFLLNASPDIRAQIESFPPLQPSNEKIRNSPIEAVLLTNADLDHTLGLLLLREGEELRIHATAAVRQSLSGGISFASALESFCGAEWMEPPTKPQPLLLRDGSAGGLTYEAILLQGKLPRYAKSQVRPLTGNVVGYRITDNKTAGRLLFLPEVGQLDDKLMNILPECEVLLFDGTFWSEDEMRERGTGSLSAADMGHLPISGASGSLNVLAKLRVKHKIYTHINNTNPILIEGSAEHAAVNVAGCLVGRDGMEIET
jgi:pyrroloquinoline quinone biosynthesis protein B